MTGPAPGKIPFKCTLIIHHNPHHKTTLEAQCYIHVKGWSLAPVTHIDAEHPQLPHACNMKPHEKTPATIIVTTRGITALPSKENKPRIDVEAPLLPQILPRTTARGIIGAKYKGIYIGMQKHLLKHLENYATKKGYPPRKQTKHSK